MGQPSTKSKILLVDDTPSTVTLVKTALEGAGYQVLVATTGEKALKRAQVTGPDLILLDILMPVCGGYETCRRLKTQETTRDIPVIFMSALTSQSDKVKGFDLGAVDYISKPIETQELLSRVNTHLTISHLRKELLDANAKLEERVLERTAELHEANMQLKQEIEHRERAEAERRSHLKFLENLDRINHVIRKAVSHEEMLTDVVESVLEMFGCDRSLLLYPCSPDTSTVRAPFECTSPEYPGTAATLGDVPLGPEGTRVFRLALESDGPLTYGPDSPRPVPTELARHFFVQSEMHMALHPRVGKPWLFSIHQCSYARTWTDEDKRLFREIGSRLTDGLSSLLFLRDLRESEEKYRTLFEQSTDAIVMSTPGGKVIDANPACAELLGKPQAELAGSEVQQFYSDPAERVAIQKELETRGFIKQHEMKVNGLDGNQKICLLASSAWKDEEGNILAYLSIARDITESRRLEERLRQAQKMEAIGTLAGGIAHDFNNLLFVITGNIECALRPDVSEREEHLQEALTAAERASDLVGQILAFSRQRTFQRSPISISPVTKEIVKFLRSSIPRTIEIRFRISEEPGLIVADPTEIHQVLMNLTTNAAYSMRQHGGRLAIELSLVDIDGDFARLHDNIPPGPYAKITVSDTGHGISPEDLERIFDPYFTTKPRGEGTGLGLAVVHGIVKGYGGTISVDTEPGKGSTFSVYLPVQRDTVAAQVDTALEDLPTGRERILVVDDEPSVTEVIRNMLNSLGYQVTAEDDPLAALERYRAGPEEFDLVITDMTMPKMTGIDLAKELKSLSPDIPIILCTGFSEQVNRERAEELGFGALLFKPIPITDLAHGVHDALHLRNTKDTETAAELY